MRRQYKQEDLGTAVRGKYLADYGKGTNLVLLSPDVAAAFPTADAVNDALRALVRLARGATPARSPANGRARKRKVA